MNVTTAPSKEDVSFAGVPVCPMPTTARNVPFKRRTGMAAPRLSILVAQRQICSMNGKSMVSKDDSAVVCL